LNLEAAEESMTKKDSGVAGVPGVQEEEVYDREQTPASN